MLSKIIQAINGKIKFCLRNDCTFFVSDCSINNNIITFTDDVDCIEYKEDLNSIDLITFTNKTIPTQADLDNIESFFEVNADDHIKNNITFDDLLQKCNEYKKIFNKQSIGKIKEAVLNRNTLEIDMLAKLGSKNIINLESCSCDEASSIITLYIKLIDEKLSKALLELDQCISDMNDKEFEQEAIIIKKDLIDNVNDFKRSINNIELKDLFNNWPTLLNPSPFNIHV